MPDIRLKCLLFALYIMLCWLCAGLISVQIMEGERYRSLSVDNKIRRVELPAPRGTVYDCNGTVLADVRPSFNLMVMKEEVTDEDALKDHIVSVLSVTRDYVDKRFSEGSPMPYMPILVYRDMSYEKMVAMQESMNSYPGIVIEAVPVRRYRFNGLAPHIIGYIGRISKDEYEARSKDGYGMNDFIGKAGIEKEYEHILKGAKGGMQIEVDSKGIRKRVLSVVPARTGGSIRLSIDARLQEVAEYEMRGIHGCIIAVEPATGMLKAAVSTPGYNPNIFISTSLSDAVSAVLTDPRHPLVDKTARGLYSPGSIFKLAIALASLKAGVLKPGYSVFCNGVLDLGKYKFRCWKRNGHGRVELVEALQHSCNIFFYQLARKAGIDILYKEIHAMGFGEQTGYELQGEKAGLLPGSGWKKRVLGTSWYPGDTCNFAIGQGYMLFTPLQIANLGCLLANKGIAYSPGVVEEAAGVRAPARRPSCIYDAPESDYDLIRKGMYMVVNSDDGTGKRAAVPGMSIAGKTGTVEVVKGEDGRKNALFLGFAPFLEPQVVVLVLIENGKSGGRTAAPVAGKIFEAFNELYGEKKHDIQ